MADDRGVLDTQATAAQGLVIPLWPEGPPTVLPAKPPESEFQRPVGPRTTTMLRNVSEATLALYRPDSGRANDVGVIVCPGGGWSILAWDHEGVDVANWLAERGYTAFLLKYRVSATPEDPAVFDKAAAAQAARIAAPLPAALAPRSLEKLITEPALIQGRQAAAEDGRRALEIARARAGEFGVDPARVGMIGFSAGAFLAVDIALEPGGAPLAFVAPIYGGETGGRPIPADAPPLFTAVTQDDRMLVGSVRSLCDDWFDADRPLELHLFNRGGHGFGMVPLGLPVDRWLDLFAAWLADQGFS